ncbi:MAG TPA: hypothetical protein ENJ53_01130, partial [Phaeodactylibacter sp.]|nr:hypothetical protein [Phaeodactylibacter sp.]
MKNRSRYLAIAISLLLIGAIFYYFSDIVAYVLVAWVLSMMGQPIFVFYKKYLKLGNSGSAGLTLATFIFLFSALIWVFVPPIVQQTRNLAGIDYASLVKSLEEPINSLNNVLVKKGLMEGEIILPKNEIANDSTQLVSPKIIEKDTLPTTEKDEIKEDKLEVTTTLVSIDSILLASGDTVTKTNITLQINIDNPQLEDITETEVDTSAIIKHSDTPIEKIQKRLFKIFNPAQIPAVFSSLVGFMGNLMVAIMSIMFISFFFLKEDKLFTNFIQALVPAGYEKKVI